MSRLELVAQVEGLLVTRGPLRTSQLASLLSEVPDMRSFLEGLHYGGRIRPVDGRLSEDDPLWERIVTENLSRP